MTTAPPGCVVATAGHVDHGKSSLVRALTGTDPDRFAEEQRRGMTIDLGFAHLQLPSGREVGFVDVPGHVRFVANMLAGVGDAAACLLVVDATEGWKPQSEEHLRILELLGTPAGVVALTKADLVDDLVWFTAPKMLGSGTRAIGELGISAIDSAITWQVDDVQQVGDDVMIRSSRRR